MPNGSTNNKKNTDQQAIADVRVGAASAAASGAGVSTGSGAAGASAAGVLTESGAAAGDAIVLHCDEDAEVDEPAQTCCSGTDISAWGYNVGLQLITPFENLLLSRIFASLGKEGAAAVALIFSQRAVLTGFLSATSRAESAQISMILGNVHQLDEIKNVIREDDSRQLVKRLKKYITPESDTTIARIRAENTRLSLLSTPSSSITLLKLELLIKELERLIKPEKELPATAANKEKENQAAIKEQNTQIRELIRTTREELVREVSHETSIAKVLLQILRCSASKNSLPLEGDEYTIDQLMVHIDGEQKYVAETIGETFRAGLVVNLLEGIISAAVLYWGFEPLYSALGQPKDVIELAIHYVQHYALTLIAKALSFAASRAALGLLKPEHAFWINLLCSIAANTGAYFLFDEKRGNTEVFADAATLSAIASFIGFAALFCYHPSYRDYQMLVFSGIKNYCDSLSKFLSRMGYVAYQGAVGGLQSMLERLTIMITAIYLGKFASKEALALFGVESQLELWVLSAGLGFGVHVMNQSRRTWDLDRPAAIRSILMGLGIGVIFPLLTSVSVGLFPEQVGELFLAGNPEGILDDLSLPGSLAVAAAGLDFLRIALGMILMSHDNPWAGAIIGLLALWADFGIGVFFQEKLNIDALLAFSANDLVGGGIAVVILAGLVYRLAIQPVGASLETSALLTDVSNESDKGDVADLSVVAAGRGQGITDPLLGDVGGPREKLLPSAAALIPYSGGEGGDDLAIAAEEGKAMPTSAAVSAKTPHLPGFFGGSVRDGETPVAGYSAADADETINSSWWWCCRRG